MKHVGWAFLLAATVCSAQPSDFRPAATNVWGAQYPRVDGLGRVEVRIKAPEATKVRLNFWSGPKLDMEKQADGSWSVTTPTLAAARSSVAASTRARWRCRSRAPTTTRSGPCPTGKCGKGGTTRR